MSNPPSQRLSLDMEPNNDGPQMPSVAPTTGGIDHFKYDHTKEAFAYASHVWSETHNKQKWIVYQALGNEVKLQIKSGMKLKNQGEKKIYQDWEKAHDKLIKDLAKSQEALVFEGAQITKTYHASRNLNGKDTIDRPVYFIDVLLPSAHLQIQRKYDEEREARHLSTEILSSTEVELLRFTPGRCYYISSPHISASISVAEEKKELAKLKGTNLDHEWLLPEALAKIMGRGRSGLRGEVGRESWMKHLAYVGSMTVETALQVENGTFELQDRNRKLPKGYVLEPVDHAAPSDSESSTNQIAESTGRYSKRARLLPAAPLPQAKNPGHGTKAPAQAKKRTNLELAGEPPAGWTLGRKAWGDKVYKNTRETWWRTHNKNTAGAKRRMEDGTFSRRTVRRFRRETEDGDVSADTDTDGEDDEVDDEQNGHDDEMSDEEDGQTLGQQIAV